MNMEDMVLISVDDHIVEPPTMFDRHSPKSLAAETPQYVMDKDGNASWWWESENKRAANNGLNAVVGRPREEYGMEPMNTQQMRLGAWEPKAHNDDMNVAGVLTSLQFPTYPGFDGSWFWTAKDKKNAERVVSAYNDWHIDEWCGMFPGRYIPTAILPLWSMEATVAEMKRLVKKGCRSATYPANPAIKGLLPSVHDDYWEPMWKLCHEENFVLNCHIGTGQSPAHASMQSPISAWITAMPMAIGADAADLLHLSALQRYPNLKFSLSEGGIGWVPYMLERCDFTYKHHGAWVRCDWGGKLPSEVFREHFLTCFIDDKFGCMNYKSIGEDIISYELDYPHSDCTWPHVPEELWDNLKDLPDAIIDKITHRNAMRFFGVDPIAQLGGRANCTIGALRAKAVGVDTSTKSMDGKDARMMGDPSKPVTSADVLVTMGERRT